MREDKGLQSNFKCFVMYLGQETCGILYLNQVCIFTKKSLLWQLDLWKTCVCIMFVCNLKKWDKFVSSAWELRNLQEHNMSGPLNMGDPRAAVPSALPLNSTLLLVNTVLTLLVNSSSLDNIKASLRWLWGKVLETSFLYGYKVKKVRLCVSFTESFIIFNF